MDEGETWRGLTYAKMGRAILAQPGAVAFQVFDARHRELNLIRGYEDAIGHKASTLEGLAKDMNILDVSSFVATVRDFNSSVRQGDFDPYRLDGKVAVRVKTLLPITMLRRLKARPRCIRTLTIPGCKGRTGSEPG